MTKLPAAANGADTLVGRGLPLEDTKPFGTPAPEELRRADNADGVGLYLPHASLRVVAGPFAGRTLPIAKTEVQIGRAGVDLNLETESVSRLQANLIYRGGQYWLHATGGTNPTLINATPCTTPTALKPGDFIRIAEHELELVLGTAAPSSEAMEEIQEVELTEELSEEQPATPSLAAPASSQLDWDAASSKLFDDDEDEAADEVPVVRITAEMAAANDAEVIASREAEAVQPETPALPAPTARARSAGMPRWMKWTAIAAAPVGGFGIVAGVMLYKLSRSTPPPAPIAVAAPKVEAPPVAAAPVAVEEPTPFPEPLPPAPEPVKAKAKSGRSVASQVSDMVRGKAKAVDPETLKLRNAYQAALADYKAARDARQDALSAATRDEATVLAAKARMEEAQKKVQELRMMLPPDWEATASR